MHMRLGHALLEFDRTIFRFSRNAVRFSAMRAIYRRETRIMSHPRATPQTDGSRTSHREEAVGGERSPNDDRKRFSQRGDDDTGSNFVAAENQFR
jgi:hypothetical protein